MANNYERTYQKFSNDVTAYLSSKLPDMPVHTSMEIGEYFTHKVSNLIVDFLTERDREWQKHFEKGRTRIGNVETKEKTIEEFRERLKTELLKVPQDHFCYAEVECIIDDVAKEL